MIVELLLQAKGRVVRLSSLDLVDTEVYQIKQLKYGGPQGLDRKTKRVATDNFTGMYLYQAKYRNTYINTNR